MELPLILDAQMASFIWHSSHSRVSMVIADGLAHTWYEYIYNCHNDIGWYSHIGEFLSGMNWLFHKRILFAIWLCFNP